MREREPTPGVAINFNEHTELVEVKVPPTEGCKTRLSFSPALAGMLGVYKDYLNPDYLQGERLVDISGGLNALYIYCGIVEPRIMGNVLASLLDVVPVNGKSGEIIARRFEKIYSTPVIRNNIFNIRITFRDSVEERVRFQKGKVIITLHLRRKKLSSL